MKLAKRVAALTPSATLEITAKAQALKAEGHDVIGLGAGEPDFNTPEHIMDAAHKAMLEGHTKYTPTGGLQALKQEIVKKFTRAIKELRMIRPKLLYVTVQSMHYIHYSRCYLMKEMKLSSQRLTG